MVVEHCDSVRDRDVDRPVGTTHSLVVLVEEHQSTLHLIA